MGGVVTIIIVITGIREELQIYCSFSDNTISVSVNRTIRYVNAVDCLMLRRNVRDKEVLAGYNVCPPDITSLNIPVEEHSF